MNSLSYRISPPNLQKFLLSSALNNSLSVLDTVGPQSSTFFLSTIQNNIPADFHKCSGKLSQAGVTCNFVYDGEKEILNFKVVERPYWLSISLVASGLKESIENS
jgi:hypothetical protein